MLQVGDSPLKQEQCNSVMAHLQNVTYTKDKSSKPSTQESRSLNYSPRPNHSSPVDSAEQILISLGQREKARQPSPYLHNAMADGAVLPLPQHHQADDDDCSNGHRDDQQANKGTAAQTEVLP